MNKIFKVKQNAFGQSVVCSEKTKARGKMKSITLAIVTASSMMGAGEAMAVTAVGTGGGTVAIVGDTAGNIAIAGKGEASANRTNSIAIGNNVTMPSIGGYIDSGENVAIGANLRLRTTDSVVLGYNNDVHSGPNDRGSNVIGTNNTLVNSGISSVIGNSNRVHSVGKFYNGMIMGDRNVAGKEGNTGDSGVQIFGFENNLPDGGYATIIGDRNTVNGSSGQFFQKPYNLMIFGQDNKVNGGGGKALGFVLGSSNTLSSSNALTVGNGNTVTNAASAVTVGFNARNTHSNSVVLGKNSASADFTYFDRVNVAGIEYGRFATSSHDDASTVSVGAGKLKRQIVNVAAGQISSTSTDAINGSQLYFVIDNLGNLANSIKTELGGNAALAPNGTITMTNIGGTGQNTIHDAIAFVNAKQGGAAVNVVQGDGITVTNATVNGEKTFTVGLSDATKANITKAQTDAAKGIADAAAAQANATKAIADAKAADNKAVAAQNTANTANTTAQAANTTANRVAATTYTFSVANGQTAATTTTGTADTWRTTAADSLTLGATTDLSVSTDGAGKVIYGLSDATKANITKAQTDAAKGIADAAAAQATADKAAADIKALDDIAVKYDSTAKDTVTLGGADGTTITNVKDGAITADSKDAVNGSQLYALTEKVNNLDATDVVAGKGTTVTKSTQGNLNTYTVSVSDETLANITKAQTDAAKGIADAAAAQATADKAAADIKALDDIAVKYDSTAKDTVTLGGADGTTITNVKDGAITADSKDAVNGSQLYAVKGVADTAKATADANKVAISALDDKKADKSALAATNAKVKANTDAIAKGFNVKTADGTSTNYQLGDTVSILGGKNIDTTTTADGITVSLKDDIAVKTIAIDGSAVGLSATGINAGDLKVTGVADGAITADSKDAVNGSQLYATNQQVNRNTQNIAKLGGNVQSLNRRVDNLADNVKKNKKRNDAGIASTAAMANIPQVMLAGKSGVGVGVGHRSGQSAIAVGYSRASDNAKHIIKLSVGMDTQSKATFGAGYMYQW